MLTSPITILRRVSFLAVLLILGSCAKGPNDIDQPGSLTTETTTLYGRITDESGASLQSVSVSAAGQTTTTDANGIFIIKDAKVPKGRAVIIAKKSGYFNAARAEMPRGDGTTRMTLSMMSNAATATVSASTGGIVKAGGASVAFQAGSFTDASGNAYSGTVNVAARYLDPETSTFYNFFSGDEEAQRTDGTTTNLVSCGVLRVELTGANGETLKLDPSKPATLSCPKPNDPKAPSGLQLWSFDETLGKWKEEGIATLQGSSYVGTVTHFTDYNFDYCGVANGTLQFRIVCNGLPMNGVVAEVLGRKVSTGADGTISIRRVAADGRPVTINVRASDNYDAYFINTPVSVTMIADQTVNAGDVSLNSPCPATLEGKIVSCEDGWTEGMVLINNGEDVRYIYTRNGHFALQVPSTIPLSLNSIDDAGNHGATVAVSPLTMSEKRDIGEIKICGPYKVNFIDLKGQAQTFQTIHMAFSPTGEKIATLTINNIVNKVFVLIFETATGDELMEIPYNSNTWSGGPNLQFSLDGKRLMIGEPAYGPTATYDISGSTPILLASFSNVKNAAITEDGEKLIGLVEKIINVFSATDGTLIKQLTNVANPADSSWLWAFGYNPSENSVIIRDPIEVNKYLIWSINNDKVLRSFYTAETSFYHNIVSEDGTRFAITSDYFNWGIYNSSLGSKINDFRIGSGGTFAQNIILTHNYFFTTDTVNGGYHIRYHNLTDGALSGTQYIQAANDLWAIAASRNEKYFAAAFNRGSNRAVRIWKLK